MLLIVAVSLLVAAPLRRRLAIQQCIEEVLQVLRQGFLLGCHQFLLQLRVSLLLSRCSIPALALQRRQEQDKEADDAEGDEADAHILDHRGEIAVL